jgi:hypothetical protein
VPVVLEECPSGAGSSAPDVANEKGATSTCSVREVALSHIPTTDSGDKDYVDITWHISFSGRTPGKAAIADVAATPPFPPMHNSTEYERLLIQDQAMVLRGVLGFPRRPGEHPRRRFALETFKFVLPLMSEEAMS